MALLRTELHHFQTSLAFGVNAVLISNKELIVLIENAGDGYVTLTTPVFTCSNIHQHQISFPGSRDDRFITCPSKTNLILDWVSCNKCENLHKIFASGNLIIEISLCSTDTKSESFIEISKHRRTNVLDSCDFTVLVEASVTEVGIFERS